MDLQSREPSSAGIIPLRKNIEFIAFIGDFCFEPRSGGNSHEFATADEHRRIDPCGHSVRGGIRQYGASAGWRLYPHLQRAPDHLSGALFERAQGMPEGMPEKRPRLPAGMLDPLPQLRQRMHFRLRQLHRGLPEVTAAPASHSGRWHSRATHPSTFSAALKVSCGLSTLPM